MSDEKWPQHVGIIMDGNGRWANRRGWRRIQGHAKGADRVISVVESTHELNIKTLSLFCFSSENWKRPEEEVSFLFELMYKFLDMQLKRLLDDNVRVRLFGDMERGPTRIQEKIQQSVELTKNNTGLNLNFLVGYGGRMEIVRAAKNLAQKVKEGSLKPEDLSEKLFSEHLYSAEVGDPDLIIRTSGEFRISNFMLWQAAYSEFFVTAKHWPDFTPVDLREACDHYAKRERRFGCVTEVEQQEQGLPA